MPAELAFASQSRGSIMRLNLIVSPTLSNCFALITSRSYAERASPAYAADRSMGSNIARLIIFRGHTVEELPAHAPRAPRPAMLAPTRSGSRRTMTCFSYDLLWADAEVKWSKPPWTEAEAAQRLKEDNVLRAALHRECMLHWLRDGERVIDSAESIERAQFGARLRATAIVNGVEQILMRQLPNTYDLLRRAPWARLYDISFTRRVPCVFHPQSAAVLFTYDGFTSGLVHPVAVAYWRPGHPLPILL
jgi:hypothetical protein